MPDDYFEKDGTFTLAICTAKISRKETAELLRELASDLEKYGANREPIYRAGNNRIQIGMMDIEYPPQE